MTTHSSILAWRIPWTAGPGRLYNPWGHKESDTARHLVHGRGIQSQRLKIRLDVGADFLKSTQESEQDNCW